MEIRWEVDDGYCGKSGPQHIEIPDEELLECEDWDDARVYIDEVVEEAFRTEIGFSINNLDEVGEFFKKNKVADGEG